MTLLAMRRSWTSPEGNRGLLQGFKWGVTESELQRGKITYSSENPGLGREPEVGTSAKRQEMLTQVKCH